MIVVSGMVRVFVDRSLIQIDVAVIVYPDDGELGTLSVEAFESIRNEF
jgi:hypothetical protein